jgi:two-component system, cell cycle response regulator
MNPSFQDVLLVDDDAVIRRILSDILTPAGYTIRHARNGIEALDVVKNTCPYIIVTDWMMSPMDGIELCNQIRKMDLPHYVYLMLLTAKSEREDLITGLNAGADDFITKPFGEGEILARLQTAQRILDLEARLNDLARCDPLTGILNRRTFYQIFEREWERAERYKHPLSCAMVDVDFFKKVNDTFGHLVGDHVLKFLAHSLENLSRSPDYVCRWGGEEFCILLPETNEEGALCWANRCCSAIAEAEFCPNHHSLGITASFGVAERQEGVLQTPEQLLDCADQALYAAKRAGRHRAVAYSSMTPHDVIPQLHRGTRSESSVRES